MQRPKQILKTLGEALRIKKKLLHPAEDYLKTSQLK